MSNATQEPTTVDMTALTEAYGATDLSLMMAEAADEDLGLPFAVVLAALDLASRNSHDGRFDAGVLLDTMTTVLGEHNGNRAILTWPDADGES